ncbi:hypothetical protein AB0J72_42445 [Dactylosporangium sp. NPDC049742]|uniref:hypothetical protein n=1 Tax=Dactylosporangium sp. NPDC049742 TaxID=3154737 RepID=UPI00344A0C42
MNEIETAFVKPFYRRMAGFGALRWADEMWADLTAAGRHVTQADVSWMLRTGHWRPEVMGAWFSLAVPAESITADLLPAMAGSRGSLTAGPLAVAAALVAGPDAVTAMTDYLTFILNRPDGSQFVVAAAVEHLGSDPVIDPTAAGRRQFQNLHEFAVRLREAFQPT